MILQKKRLDLCSFFSPFGLYNHAFLEIHCNENNVFCFFFLICNFFLTKDIYQENYLKNYISDHFLNSNRCESGMDKEICLKRSSFVMKNIRWVGHKLPAPSSQQQKEEEGRGCFLPTAPPKSQENFLRTTVLKICFLP